MPLALWLEEVQGSQPFMGYSSTWHNRASVTTHTCWSPQGFDEVPGIHLLTAPSAPQAKDPELQPTRPQTSSPRNRLVGWLASTGGEPRD